LDGAFKGRGGRGTRPNKLLFVDGAVGRRLGSAAMPDPTPQVSNRLRRIQNALGVEADGLLGPETLTALEKKLKVDVAPANASLECSCGSLDLIVRFEVTSPQVYERLYRRPAWPGGESGVTIGIGYDLGYATREQVEADWGPHLEQPDREALRGVIGVKGAVAQQLAKNISRVIVPLAAAQHVFYTRTLPRYARMTRAVFPGVQDLPPDAQGALLSLVFNRGDGVKDTDPRRREMLGIRTLLKGGRRSLVDIAGLVESMERLWPAVAGLRERRRREAAMIRGARRAYAKDEIVVV
jgi:hypothetical protein